MANYFKGDDLRSYFHSFGRAFTAEGQNFLDAAPLKSGHTVSTSDVRAEAVPYINANFELEQAFNGVAAGTCILTGENGSRTVIPELSGILKFYDGVTLSEMELTNGETYQLIDGSVVKGFIDPTDAFDSTGKKAADGYTIKVLKGDGTPIPMSYGWVVDPVNGAVTFEKGKTPANKSYGAIKIIAFAYVGKYAASEIENIWNAIGKDGDNPDATLGGRLTIAEEDIKTISGDLIDESTQRGDDDEFLSGSIDYLSGVVEDLSDVVEDLSGVVISGSYGVNVTIDSSKNKEISLVKTNDTNGLTFTADGIRSKIELVKDTSIDNLTSYQLKINDINVGDPIEIDKERFVSSGSYDPVTEELVLTITGQESPIRIPVSTLITEHVKGNGINIVDISVSGDTKREISVKKSTASEEFLYVNESGVGLSGIQDAIDTAVSGITEVLSGSIEELSGAIDIRDDEAVAEAVAEANSYTDRTVSGAVEELSGAIDIRDAEVSGIVKDYVDDNYLKSISGTGAIRVSNK